MTAYQLFIDLPRNPRLYWRAWLMKRLHASHERDKASCIQSVSYGRVTVDCKT